MATALRGKNKTDTIIEAKAAGTPRPSTRFGRAATALAANARQLADCAEEMAGAYAGGGAAAATAASPAAPRGRKRSG